LWVIPFFVRLTEYIIRGPDTYVNNFPNIVLIIIIIIVIIIIVIIIIIIIILIYTHT
jgi:hypothetical protein